MSAPPPLKKERISELLLPYGVEADDQLCGMINIYISTLLQWNAKISLTTVTDPEEIVRFHFGESFFAVSAFGIAKGRLADIGTGAGFPGIPIRMVRPYVDLTLIEPNAKKTAFLAEVGRKLNLENLNIIRKRMEEIREGDCDNFDFVTARALGNYEKLLHWSKEHTVPTGCVILWLGIEDSAIISGYSGWLWEGPVKIPGSRSRVVLIGSQIRK